MVEILHLQLRFKFGWASYTRLQPEDSMMQHTLVTAHYWCISIYICIICGICCC